MPDVFTTTADLLQLGDGNISDIDVTELLEDAPVLAAMAAQVASYETTHEWIKKTVAPVVGFREINDGRENDKATYEKVVKTLELFDAGFVIDQGLLKSASGPALRVREARDHLAAAFADMEQQVIYGTAKHANGFEGFGDEKNALSDPMVISGGGVAASAQTSVWAVRNMVDATSLVYGLNGRIEIGMEYPTIMPGSTTGRYDAMRTPILFYSCVQIATSLDLGRLANLDATATLDDDKLSQLLSLFPANRQPHFFAMNRQSLQQLQASRTATNVTGAPAPFPSEAFNVPIIVTDQINNTEAVVA